MKYMIKRFYVLVLMFVNVIAASSQTFSVDGIRYKVVADKNVVVLSYSNSMENNENIEIGDSGGPADAKALTVNAIETYRVTVPSVVSYDNEQYTVTSIMAEAFSNLKYLSAVTIPASVSSIGENAFNNCTSLDTIFCYITEPIEVAENTFGNKSCTLVIPYLSHDSYKKTAVWNGFSILSLGDINTDNVINIVDISQMTAILNEQYPLTYIADMNNDGKITIDDLQLVEQIVLLKK